MVEENGANVIEVTVQCEETSSCLVGPDFDLVVVTTRDEERLRLVKVDASNRSVVFLESIDERAHSIVPKLNGGRMEGDENPWPSWGASGQRLPTLLQSHGNQGANCYYRLG